MKQKKDKALRELAKEFAIDDLDQELQGKTAEERMQVFEREGVTRDERAAARAHMRKLIADHVEKPPAPPRRRWFVGGGAALAMAAALVLVITHPRTKPVIDTTAGSTGAPRMVPVWEVERGKAYEACLRHDYAMCLGYLERARRADPAGDESVAVRNAREMALRGLRAERDAP